MVQAERNPYNRRAVQAAFDMGTEAGRRDDGYIQLTRHEYQNMVKAITSLAMDVNTLTTYARQISEMCAQVAPFVATMIPLPGLKIPAMPGI